MKALLVDDDADVRFLAGLMFRQSGADSLETAAGGEEALALLQAGAAPDVLILDQVMPGMSGVQLLAKVRERYPDLPVLFSSGVHGMEGWDELRRPGVAVMSKPFTLEEMHAKVAMLRDGWDPAK